MSIDQYHNKIISGDALTVLRRFPDESVHCIITSPPYDRKEVLAYLAGIVDGEGYVGIKKDLSSVRSGHSRSPLYHERIQIRMINEGAISLFQKVLGGNYYHEKRPYGKHPMYCYQASDRLATHILRKLLPFLIVKRRQAELVLRLRDSKDGPQTYGSLGNKKGRRGTPMSRHILQHRESLYQMVKKLNGGEATASQ